MKEKFLKLVEQMEDLEKKFHKAVDASGHVLPYEEQINDIPEFQVWIEGIKFELHKIVNAAENPYVVETLTVANQNFNGWNDKTKFNTLKARLLIMYENIDEFCLESDEIIMDDTKPPKIFISHSSRDKNFVVKIVELLEGMGLDERQVFCSSLPGYDIPVGMDIFDYLKELFVSYKLHVMFIHSKNYYKSAVSLNEMGAAWVLKSEVTSFLLPKFEFKDMVGVVNGETVAIKLDNNEFEVKDKLNQLYVRLIDEFNLTKKGDIIWEQKRNCFIKEINEMGELISEDNSQISEDLELLGAGLYIRKSEYEAGKRIYYCPTCYQNYGRLYPVAQGSVRRERFCPNCNTHYSLLR